MNVTKQSDPQSTPKDHLMKLRKILKITGLSLLVLVATVVGFGYWFMGLIAADRQNYTDNREDIKPSEIAYLSEDSIPQRGKILAVVTSTPEMGASGKRTGYELTELSRAYYVFTANGFEVDIASPKGGNPPVVIDDDDVDIYDFAFLNDPVAQAKVRESLAMEDVVFEDYQGVYFVGGKGAMYDFPENPTIQALVRTYYEENKVIGAVCHGPAALTHVSLSNGQSLLNGKKVSGFTNEEELFLIPEAENIFPFLLQDELSKSGAQFSEGTMYLENVTQDGNILTGQNPWSTWTLAESMISQLGYTPKPRAKTSEEYSVQVLVSYQNEGIAPARELIDSCIANSQPLSRELIAVHGIMSTMQWKLGKTIDMLRLLQHIKSSQKDV